MIIPRSPYAEVKLTEEKILKKNSKVKYITLRFGTISGFSEGMRFHTAVNKFCLNAVLGIKIPVWENQQIYIDPILASKMLRKLLNL